MPAPAFALGMWLLLLCHFSFTAVALTPDQLAQLRETNSISQSGVGRSAMNPFVALMAAGQRYGVEVPTAVVAAAAAAPSKGTIGNNPTAGDAEWLCNVTVGNQIMKMDFDTGSADFWVFSKSLPPGEQGSHVLYQLEGTRLTGKTWAAQYALGGGASGVVYADKVVAGPFTVTSMGVQAATSVSSSIVSNSLDGILGLGFGTLNTCKPAACYTFQKRLGPSLAQNLFTATLRDQAPGTYDFGFIDSAKYTGTLTYVNVDESTGFWQFTSSGFAIGTATKTPSAPIHNIVDTGTTYTYINEGIVDAYYTHVSGAYFNTSYNVYLFPCTSTLPNFSLFFANARRTMPGAYVNAGFIDGSTCLGSLQRNTGMGTSVIGDSFLKSQFVVFNKQTTPSRIGWAQQAPN